MKRTSIFRYLTTGLLFATIAVLLYSHTQLKERNAQLTDQIKTLNIRVDNMKNKSRDLKAQIEQLQLDNNPKFQELIANNQ